VLVNLNQDLKFWCPDFFSTHTSIRTRWFRIWC